MLKNIFYLVIILLFSLSINAQDHAFKVNPLAIAFNGFEVSYESRANKNNSFELIAGFGRIKVDNSGKNIKTIAVEIKYKFFLTPSSKTFEGWYIAPIGSYGEGSRIYESRKDKINFVGIGIIGGHQWIFNKDKTHGFLLDLNLGLSNYFTKSTPYIDDKNAKGIIPRIGVSLGYAF